MVQVQEEKVIETPPVEKFKRLDIALTAIVVVLVIFAFVVAALQIHYMNKDHNMKMARLREVTAVENIIKS